MSIKIEISAISIDELADKLLALGAKLSGITLCDPSALPTAGDTPVAEKPKRKPKPPLEAETAASTVAGTGSTTETETVAEEVVEPVSLSFETDIAPVVIKLVTAKGKPVVSAILDQFGAARASEVDETRWPELLELLNAAL